MHVRVLLVALLLSATAAASTVEETVQTVAPGAHYQEDGGHSGDAPNRCADVDLDRGFDPLDDSGTGILIEGEDDVDVYAYSAGSAELGERVRVSLELSQIYEGVEVAFDILDSSCSESVFDPDASFNQDTNTYPPTVPLQAGSGEAVFTYTADDLGWQARNDPNSTTFPKWQCTDPGSHEWRVKFNSPSGTTWPSQMYMEWTDGSYAYVSQMQNGSAEAKFRHDSDFNYTLKHVKIVMADDWTGGPTHTKGPCDGTVGTPPTPPTPPYQNGLYGEFTFHEQDDYVVVAWIAKGAADSTASTLDDLMGELQDPLAPRHVNCDFGTCRGYDGTIDYTFLTQSQTVG